MPFFEELLINESHSVVQTEERSQLQNPAINITCKRHLNICTFNNISKRKIQLKLASYYEKGSDSSRLYSHYIYLWFASGFFVLTRINGKTYLQYPAF